MSAVAERTLPAWADAMSKAEPKFTELSKQAGVPVSWQIEANHARQLIEKNDYSMKVANSNPKSLRDAIINVATVGLSLNPAQALAYLVPRDGNIVLDISYIGLLKLATDTGMVVWARAEMVHGSDRFKANGPAAMPDHEYDPFSERGDFRGVYCIAKLHNGDILAEFMSAQQIYDVRNTSMAYLKAKKGPWVTWFDQMAKKTVIKRAFKTWPKTDGSERLAEAIGILNEHEGLDQDSADPPWLDRPRIENLRPTVEYIQQKILNDELQDAAEAYNEMSTEDRTAINVSPKKCKELGIDELFTTKERDFVNRSSEFKEARFAAGNFQGDQL